LLNPSDFKAKVRQNRFCVGCVAPPQTRLRKLTVTPHNATVSKNIQWSFSNKITDYCCYNDDYLGDEISCFV